MVATNSDITVSITRRDFLVGGIPPQQIRWTELTAEDWYEVLWGEIHAVRSHLRYLGQPINIEALKGKLTRSAELIVPHKLYAEPFGLIRIINPNDPLMTVLVPSQYELGGPVYIGEDGELVGVLYQRHSTAVWGRTSSIFVLERQILIDAIEDDLQKGIGLRKAGDLAVPTFIRRFKTLLKQYAKQRCDRARRTEDVVASLGQGVGRVRLF